MKTSWANQVERKPISFYIRRISRENCKLNTFKDIKKEQPKLFFSLYALTIIIR